MPEKGPTKVAISVVRSRPQLPKVAIASRFCIRSEKAGEGYLELLFECLDRTHPVERVILDTTIVRTNLEMFKQYVAALKANEHDDALGENIPLVSGGGVANILHFAHIGGRAETVFGFVSFADWVKATKGDKKEVQSMDIISVLSSGGFQKKLLLELILKMKGSEA